MPPLNPFQQEQLNRHTNRLSPYTEPEDMNPFARWVQQKLGIIGPGRTSNVQNMTDPAYGVQSRLGLVSPEDQRARRRGGIPPAPPSHQVSQVSRGSSGPPRTPMMSGADRLSAVHGGGVTSGRARSDQYGSQEIWDDPDTFIPPNQGQQAQQPVDPYSEFLQGYKSDLAGSYDAQIDAIGGLGGLFRDQATEAQGNIGGFFDYAGDVARQGIPVTEDIYNTGIDNVQGVYDDLGERLTSMPQTLTDTAAKAAGDSFSGDIAGRVSAATAPFAAAGETARANAVANLTQHSTAGQNYLNQLAGATGAEGALHQSAVEQSLNQQMQLVAYRQAELEGSKQRAMMQMTADIAGSNAEHMANMALSQALGLDYLPPNVDPSDYVRLKNMMAGDEVDPIKQQKDLLGLQQAEVNLTRSLDPEFDRNQILTKLGGEGGLESHSVDVVKQIEELAMNRMSQEVGTQRDLTSFMLEELDQMVAQLAGDETGQESGVWWGLSDENTQRELRQAIRALYG